MLSASSYLSPDEALGGSITAEDSATFQMAFLHQGLYNTMYYTDCATSWLGVNVRQPPQDLMVFQQLIHRLRPGLFVETGTFRGGLAYYVATLFRLLGLDDSRVVTIDMLPRAEATDCGDQHGWRSVEDLSQDPVWQRHVLELVHANGSVAQQVRAAVRRQFALVPPGEHVMVSLDASHMERDVLQELRAYAGLVTVGSYLVVQDVILSFAKHPWKGPLNAVLRFLDSPPKVRRRLGSFVWDRSVERFGYTGHAYLRRVA